MCDESVVLIDDWTLCAISDVLFLASSTTKSSDASSLFTPAICEETPSLLSRRSRSESVGALGTCRDCSIPEELSASLVGLPVGS